MKIYCEIRNNRTAHFSPNTIIQDLDLRTRVVDYNNVI